MSGNFRNQIIETKTKRITVSFQSDGITVCESEKINLLADDKKSKFLFSNMQNIYVSRELNLWDCVKTVVGGIVGIIFSTVAFYIGSTGWGWLALIITAISLLFLKDEIYDSIVHIIVYSGIAVINYEIKSHNLKEAEELANTINYAWKLSYKQQTNECKGEKNNE